MSEWDDREDRLWWNPHRPRRVEGGIRARSGSGGASQHWWTTAWVRLMEGVRYGASLELGARYARAGQVVELQIASGEASALVQGSRPKPYRVRIQVAPMPLSQWQALAAELARQVAWTARLLNGDLPRDIDQFCQRHGIALLPESMQHLQTQCNCPNQVTLCKHIGAIWTLLAEEMDRDPLLLFRLRGIERDELMAMLPRASATPSQRTPAEAPAATPPGASSVSIARFWQGAPIDPALFGELPPPDSASPILQRLGPFPFWQGEPSLEDELRPIYQRAAQNGLRGWLGDEAGDEVGGKE